MRAVHRAPDGPRAAQPKVQHLGADMAGQVEAVGKDVTAFPREWSGRTRGRQDHAGCRPLLPIRGDPGGHQMSGGGTRPEHDLPHQSGRRRDRPSTAVTCAAPTGPHRPGPTGPWVQPAPPPVNTGYERDRIAHRPVPQDDPTTRTSPNEHAALKFLRLVAAPRESPRRRRLPDAPGQIGLA
jgi:hypothetical protein